MENSKERNGRWLSVPQFGEWDHQKGELPDYSLDFSKIREMRKLHKRDASRASIGNEYELIIPTAISAKADDDGHHHHYYQSQQSPSTRRRILSYFNRFNKFSCCVKA